MNWEHLTEFKTPDAGRRILARLAADRFGLAVAGGSDDSVPQAKALALARGAGEEYVRATRESLISRRYPLARAVYAYFKRRPCAPMDGRVGAFLRYVLSRERQQDISNGADYLPLSPAMAFQQLQKLE
jgi:phosphate transport system substrate-binding protein